MWSVVNTSAIYIFSEAFRRPRQVVRVISKCFLRDDDFVSFVVPRQSRLCNRNETQYISKRVLLPQHKTISRLFFVAL